MLFDQRGAGKSVPACELRNNTIAHLVQDIEILRNHLQIPRWHLVFGGSWGSTLALLYTQSHPEAVQSLILRGVSLFRKSEHEWHNPISGGISQLHPDACDEFLSIFNEQEIQDWENVFYRRLTSDDRGVRVKAARDFNIYSAKTGTLRFNPDSLKRIDNETWSLQTATMLWHYIINSGFMREEQMLEMDEIEKIRHIPCTIIHGCHDIICPPKSAWDLHKAWPEAKLIMIPNAGHAATEPGTFEELVKACNDFATL